MTAVERLAEFAVSTPYEELSETARQQLKIRILDALGCAIGAIDAKPPRMIRKPTSPNSIPTENAHCLPEAGQAPNMRHFTMEPPSATWTSTTVTWQRAKPAIPAIIWRPFWPRQSMLARAAGT